MRMTTRPRWRLVGAIAAVCALVLAGCSGDDASVGDDSAGAADDGGVSEGEEGAAGDAPSPDADGDVSEPAAPTGRDVIRTAELVLEVDDTSAVADEIERIVTDAGGYVATADLSRDEDGVVRGRLTVRVPSDELLDTVDTFDELAVAVPVRRIDETDVSTQVTDLEAELTNLRAYERELRTLLGDVRENTTNPDDLLRIFERIREVRGGIDQAQARLDSLEDQVAMSTINVTLRPAASALPVTDPSWKPGETVRGALSATAEGLTFLADVVIRLVLTALPLALLVLGPFVLVGWLIVRRGRRTDRATPPTPTGDDRTEATSGAGTGGDTRPSPPPAP